MSRLKRQKTWLPKGFVWRLSAINILFLTISIAISGWAVYHTACFLVEGMTSFSETRQKQFNATLFQYLWIFSLITITFGSVLHYYFVNKLIRPLRQLIDSTQQMKQGTFPKPLKPKNHDEVGELMIHFNEMVSQLQYNETERKKMIADISHELRTPLANLNGYLQALKNGVVVGNTELYDALLQESKRMTMMLEQLEQLKEWDHLREQSFIHKERCQIDKVIDQSVRMFDWSLKEARIPLKRSIEKQELYMNREGIHQVLSNLLDNAIQYYRDDDGRNSIQIEGKMMPNDMYRVSVTGPSDDISKEDEHRIFERFYRIDHSRNRATGGSGLGLAIAKEIVDQHHGKIGLERGGKHNSFWFELPVSLDRTIAGK